MKQWTPLIVVLGPAHAKANAYCCGQVRKSTVRHNQVGVQDQKWPPPPDKINHGHAKEPTTCNILKDLCVSLDRHFYSKL